MEADSNWLGKRKKLSVAVKFDGFARRVNDHGTMVAGFQVLLDSTF